jgi:hypothetical protein
VKEDTEELDLDVDVDVATKEFLIIFPHLDWNTFSHKHFGSAVNPNPDSMVSLNPYRDPDSQSGSGSRRANLTHKILKNVSKFLFLKY